MNLVNANCDATCPKSKRELLKDLDVWEKSQGGKARPREDEIMKKNFDGPGWVGRNRKQFDELIANARKPVRRPATSTEEGEDGKQPSAEDDVAVAALDFAPKEQESSSGVQPLPDPPPQQTKGDNDDMPHPYENNSSALKTIRDKVDEVNRTGDTMHSLHPSLHFLSSASQNQTQQTPSQNESLSQPSPEEPQPQGHQDHPAEHHYESQEQKEAPSELPNHFAAAVKGPETRTVPMFQVPEEPVVDVENAAVGK